MIYRNLTEFENKEVRWGDIFVFGMYVYKYTNLGGLSNINQCIDPELIFRKLKLNRIELYKEFYKTECAEDCDWPQRFKEDPRIITLLVRRMFKSLEPSD